MADCHGRLWDGLIALANGIGDTLQKITAERVFEKSESRGRNPTDYLQLEPAVLDGQRVEVAKTLYEEIEAGDRICVDYHNGNIGLRWYAVHQCTADEIA